MKEFGKKLFFEFILIQSAITIAMGTIGVTFVKGMTVPYYAFFLPAVFAALTLLPDVIFYSTTEQTIKRTILVKCVKLLMREVIVLGLQKILSPTTSTMLLIILGITVFIIAVIINIIFWIYDKNDSVQMNQKLAKYHEQNMAQS